MARKAPPGLRFEMGLRLRFVRGVGQLLGGRGVARRWAGRGFWAVMDQGSFAVSNFGLNVLLARLLLPTDYGAFSVAYTIFLLLGTIHTATLTEPMLVYGPRKYRDRLAAYFSVLLRGHWLFGALVAALFGAVGFTLLISSHSPITLDILGLAAASPFILFQWLMRRACYVELQPRLAASAGAIYMILIAAIVLALFQSHRLTGVSALLAMGASSLVSGLWLARRVRAGFAGPRRESLAREVFADHLQYGRWAAGAAGLSWAASNIFFVILPILADLDAVATLRAAFNFIMPMLQVFAALSLMVLPQLARARHRGALSKEAALTLALYMGLALAYAGCLLVFESPAKALLYGSAYPGLRNYIRILAVFPVTQTVVFVLSAALRAAERPRAVFLAYLASTLVSLSFGTLLVSSFGAIGAAIGMLLASLTTGSVLLIQFSGPPEATS